MSGAHGVAGEEPHCHPTGSLSLESTEGSGLCRENSVYCTYAVAHHQHVVITSDTISHVTAEWIPHLCLCIFHNGGHIEHFVNTSHFHLFSLCFQAYGTF